MMDAVAAVDKDKPATIDDEIEESKPSIQSNAEPRPHRNPAEEIARWQFMLFKLNDIKVLSQKIQVLSNECHFSKAQFDGLKPIMLGDMQVPMIHEGRYLICKVAAKPYSIVGMIKPSPVAGVKMLIEDLNGDIEEAALFNCCFKLDKDDWISLGTIFIIKEPKLCYGKNNHSVFLRVDSPSDIIFVDPTDEEFLKKTGALNWHESSSKEAKFWDAKAFEYFTNRDYEKALMLYDRAIRVNPALAVLYLNKSLTCIKMGAFYKAYDAAKLGLEKGGNREKALLRMGQAAYGMRDWEKAVNHYHELQKEFPKNAVVGKELKRANARLNEEKHGKYNFKDMYMESLKEKPDLDAADFVGPIKIEDIPGKGRGIIATEDIKEGTLLLFFKAFASGYRHDFPKRLMFVQSAPNCPEHMLQFIHAIQYLQNNPQRGHEIYDLYAGDMSIDKDIPFGVIDTARIAKISANNPFVSDELTPDAMANLTNDQNSHLFTLPSYFNHACLANAYRIFYGNALAVYAISDIKKGDEIYLTYLYPLKRYSERQEIISRRGFACQCKLCEIDANDKFCSKRNDMYCEMEQYKKNYSPQFVIAKGVPILKKIRESYANRKEHQVVLAQALVILSSTYFNTGSPTKSIACLEEAVAIMDNDPLKHAFRIADIHVNLGSCYLSNGNRTKFNQMMKKAMKLSFCSHIDHFKQLYPEIAGYLPAKL